MNWAPRWPPLEPLFVVLPRKRVEVRDGLRGVVSGEFLALTGTELPWVEGARYFGRDGASPWLLVPTNVVSSIPTSWLERRYRADHPNLAWPCLLLDGALLPVGRAGAIDPAQLRAWVDGA